tara:strand:- start:2219 stop:2443 length:225 start_codon:yes stop_codon:yes gene_type:complete
MQIYVETILFYLFLLDCLAYNVLAWTKDKWHNKLTHWASQHFPLNKLMAAYYLSIILWLGFALYRMQLLGFYLG